MEIKRIVINKNRGWRGLAEAKCLDAENKPVLRMIFSFSQPVWDTMQKGKMVLQDSDHYYIVCFHNAYKLPKGQRSVLIKNFDEEVWQVFTYNKSGWIDHSMTDGNYTAIREFTLNRNNHTQSDWNCIGIRVTPIS